jgi:small neutral amino acid transporter SnatA (MarC family)
MRRWPPSRILPEEDRIRTVTSVEPTTAVLRGKYDERGKNMTIGPVQLIALGFSQPDFHGEIIAELERLHESGTVRVIDSLAVFPLAVPYLLNPAGIVVLVTASAEAGSFGVFAVVVGALAIVIALDAAVFRWANRVSDHLNENRMLVTEKVFGFLLAALAVQLALDGLADLGVIHLIQH